MIDLNNNIVGTNLTIPAWGRVPLLVVWESLHHLKGQPIEGKLITMENYSEWAPVEWQCMHVQCCCAVFKRLVEDCNRAAAEYNIVEKFGKKLFLEWSCFFQPFYFCSAVSLNLYYERYNNLIKPPWYVGSWRVKEFIFHHNIVIGTPFNVYARTWTSYYDLRFNMM